ncbi:hypothetical protein, partial [Vibrio parahaemolyticus]
VDEIKSKTQAQHFAFILNSSTKASEINGFLASIGERKFSFIHNASFSDPKFLFSISSNVNFCHHIFIDSNVSRSYKQQFNDFSRV